jgi:hypothetical protein
MGTLTSMDCPCGFRGEVTYGCGMGVDDVVVLEQLRRAAMLTNSYRNLRSSVPTLEKRSTHYAPCRITLRRTFPDLKNEQIDL